MTKQYRPWTPEQTYLLPPSPMEWLPEGHLAYFVLEVVRELDVGAIEAAIHKKDPRGERPYAPRMMTTLLLYAYCTGVFSSRKIERATYEDVAFRVITGESHPHFTTVNTFRLEHREALADLFMQVLRLCARAGLQTVGHIALDGSKVQANASKHKAMSYGRMKEEETRLVEEIDELLARADATDVREDEQHGCDKRGDELPEELRRRETRLARIREAKAELEREAAAARAAALRENAEALREKAADLVHPARERRAAETLACKSDAQADKLAPRDDDDDDDDENGGASTVLPAHRVQTTPDGRPKDTAQRNFTDGDSRIMIRNGVFVQGYNAQAAVSEDQIIVAHGLTNAPTDVEQLQSMLERTRQNCGAAPAILSADNGYLSEANVAYCDANGVDAYMPPRKGDVERTEFPPTTSAQHMYFAMQIKLRTEVGRALYALRKVIVEPVFGQIKAAMGFRCFSLRGRAKAECEWAIVCACHNLLKLFRAERLGGASAIAA